METLDKALEYLTTHLENSDDTEFSVSLEETLFIFDLDDDQRDDLIEMYDDCDMQSLQDEIDHINNTTK